MIVDDEKEEAGNILDLNEEAGTSIVLPSVFTHGDMPVLPRYLKEMPESAIVQRIEP
jgi:hypothetical protein